MFNGTERYDVPVCKISTYKKYPCINKGCKHHVCHVPSSQSGVEYVVHKASEIENRPCRPKQ